MRTLNIFLSALVLSTLVSPLWSTVNAQEAETEAEKQTVSDEKLKAEYDMIFGESLDKALKSRGHEDDLDLAQLMITSAQQVEDNPRFSRLALIDAVKLAARHEDGHELAIEAQGLLQEMGENRSEGLLLDVYEEKFRRARGNDKREAAGQLLIALLAAGDTAALEGDVPSAGRHYRKALSMSRLVKEFDRDHVTERIRALRDLEAYEDELQEKKDAFVKDPTNKTLMTELVEMLVRERFDLSEAKALAELAKDAEMIQRLTDAGVQVDDIEVERRLELAQWYERLIDDATLIGQSELLPKTALLYAAFLDDYEEEDLKRLKAKVSLEKIQERLPKSFKIQPKLKELVIEAQVDGLSELWVTPKGIFWKHLAFAKPGLHANANEPTMINGKPWMPKWGNDQLRAADQSQGLPMKIGKYKEIEIVPIYINPQRGGPHEPGNNQYITHRAEGDAWVITIDDKPGMHRWYKFKIILK